MTDPFGLSLGELLEALRARRISAVELAQATLDRIRSRNATINAIVALADPERVLAQARESQTRILRGEARALEGVPFAVKDLEDAEGFPTSKGSVAFREIVSPIDSVQVERLRAAGAIPIGKTNAPELGSSALTRNRLYGITRNPWDPKRTPGGSSGGSAAALASGLVPLVTASDGAGSIRIPASFVGAVGMKPTFGRIPRGPSDAWSYLDTSTLGPIARTVEDAAYVLDVLCGPSSHDPKSLPHPGYRYLDRVREGAPRGLRIGFSPAFGALAVQSDVAALVEDAVRALERLGHRVKEVRGAPPAPGAALQLVAAFELASELHLRLPEIESDLGRSVLRTVKSGWDMTPEYWGDAARQRMAVCRWCARVFEDYDLLVTPTVAFDPPPAEGPLPAELDGRRIPPWAVAAFALPFNLSWQPAATVRAGMSQAGLPVGMQVVGERHRDDLVLQVARAFERERPAHPHWPLEEVRS